MRSSISNSRIEKRIFWLLVVVALLVPLSGVMLEVFARRVVLTSSADLSRIVSEKKASESLNASEREETTLVVGNSLLLWGLDVDLLNSRMDERGQVLRFAIQQTTFYDWRYGLRRLVALEMPPRSIVLALEPRHLLAGTVREDFFAYFLMHPRDLVEVARYTKQSRTEMVSMLVAHSSAFYALRKEIRKFLLLKILPNLPELTTRIARYETEPAEPSALRRIVPGRLAALKRDTDAAGVRLTILVMPPVSKSQALALQEAGSEVGVRVVSPILDSDLSARHFQDDQYHLNSAGREMLTLRSVEVFRATLRGAK